MSGYHLTKIAKGVLGELSKIEEELNELIDADKQQSKIMIGCELSDLYGAIEAYASKYNYTMNDLDVMSKITKRAFAVGERTTQDRANVITSSLVSQSTDVITNDKFIVPNIDVAVAVAEEQIFYSVEEINLLKNFITDYCVLYSNAEETLYFLEHKTCDGAYKGFILGYGRAKLSHEILTLKAIKGSFKANAHLVDAKSFLNDKVIIWEKVVELDTLTEIYSYIEYKSPTSILITKTIFDHDLKYKGEITDEVNFFISNSYPMRRELLEYVNSVKAHEDKVDDLNLYSWDADIGADAEEDLKKLQKEYKVNHVKDLTESNNIDCVKSDGLNFLTKNCNIFRDKEFLIVETFSHTENTFKGIIIHNNSQYKEYNHKYHYGNFDADIKLNLKQILGNTIINNMNFINGNFDLYQNRLVLQNSSRPFIAEFKCDRSIVINLKDKQNTITHTTEINNDYIVKSLYEKYIALESKEYSSHLYDYVNIWFKNNAIMIKELKTVIANKAIKDADKLIKKAFEFPDINAENLFKDNVIDGDSSELMETDEKPFSSKPINYNLNLTTLRKFNVMFKNHFIILELKTSDNHFAGVIIPFNLFEIKDYGAYLNRLHLDVVNDANTWYKFKLITNNKQTASTNVLTPYFNASCTADDAEEDLLNVLANPKESCLYTKYDSSFTLSSTAKCVIDYMVDKKEWDIKRNADKKLIYPAITYEVKNCYTGLITKGQLDKVLLSEGKVIPNNDDRNSYEPFHNVDFITENKEYEYMVLDVINNDLSAKEHLFNLLEQAKGVK